MSIYDTLIRVIFFLAILEAAFRHVATATFWDYLYLFLFLFRCIGLSTCISANVKCDSVHIFLLRDSLVFIMPLTKLDSLSEEFKTTLRLGWYLRPTKELVTIHNITVTKQNHGKISNVLVEYLTSQARKRIE